MRLSAAAVIKRLDMNRPRSGKCCTRSHLLSVNRHKDGKIITYINFNLQSNTSGMAGQWEDLKLEAEITTDGPD